MNVNPTRMELTNLKKKLVTARRGHKLLKDKLDELMRQFLILVKENKRLRAEFERGINDANAHMAVAGSLMDSQSLDVAFLMSQQKAAVEVSEKNIMSVNVPEFKIDYRLADADEIYSYGFAFTSGDLDKGVKAIYDTVPIMLKLAEAEKQCQLLSAEIERTRRRVNALEHIIIPQYTDTIKYITMKLDENERASTTRLMKVKDMMLEKAHGYNND